MSCFLALFCSLEILSVSFSPSRFSWCVYFVFFFVVVEKASFRPNSFLSVTSLFLPVILDPQAGDGKSLFFSLSLDPSSSLSSILYLCLSIFSLLFLSSLKLIQPLQLDHSFILSSFPFAFHVFPSFFFFFVLCWSLQRYCIRSLILFSRLQILYESLYSASFFLLSLFVSCLCMLYVDGSHRTERSSEKSERTRWRSFFVIQDTEHTDQETSKRETVRKKRRRKTEQVLQKER